MNAGIFLCMKEGYYQFSAGIGVAAGMEANAYIGVYLSVNSRHKTYAR